MFVFSSRCRESNFHFIIIRLRLFIFEKYPGHKTPKVFSSLRVRNATSFLLKFLHNLWDRFKFVPSYCDVVLVIVNSTQFGQINKLRKPLRNIHTQHCVKRLFCVTFARTKRKNLLFNLRRTKISQTLKMGCVRFNSNYGRTFYPYFPYRFVRTVVMMKIKTYSSSVTAIHSCNQNG